MAATTLGVRDSGSAAANLFDSELIPRPEYPQPQFQRADWMNLNGVWAFDFVDANAGLDANWAAPDHNFSRSILVPFCFESPLSGIGDKGFHPYCWYQRKFSRPENWESRRVLLHFGAVDYKATVWVNGHFAGEHEGGHTPFRLDITGLLHAGANTLTVRVEDPPEDRRIPRGKQHWKKGSASIFYTRTSGIWQTVWLESVGSTYLERVKIDPRADGAVAFQARIARCSDEVQFFATVKRSGRVLGVSMARPVGGQATASVVVVDPEWWSPDEPNLYEVTLELRKGDEVLDSVESYFGFRTVRVQDGRVLLNGNPIYLKMVLDQGYWPEANLTPPSDEAIRDDIRLTKEMGFNGARKHQTIEDPRYLYWADRMGLLVSAEMANAYLFDDAYVSRFTKEWIEAVQRDYNHPSIIMWAPLNESWGVPDAADPRQQSHMRAMYHLTRSLDSTRLVIDNDGWEHTENTDLFAIHDYTRTGEQLFERFIRCPDSEAPLPQAGKMYLAPGCKYNGAPLFLSEFGGIAYIPEAEKNSIPDNSWGYSGIELTEAAALERMRRLYQAIARLPRFAGICYTQLCDVEREVNGLLTYDRRPKFDPAEIRAINDLL
jgi:beta-galactosidase/beta-glucuronidase